jgi:hypothetical protein
MVRKHEFFGDRGMIAVLARLINSGQQEHCIGQKLTRGFDISGSCRINHYHVSNPELLLQNVFCNNCAKKGALSVAALIILSVFGNGCCIWPMIFQPYIEIKPICAVRMSFKILFLDCRSCCFA